MEPARDGWENEQRAVQVGGVPLSAMEPAAQRRDDPFDFRDMYRWDMPQWSPPLGGGTTLAAVGGADLEELESPCL
jgi:hypothetical protein